VPEPARRPERRAPARRAGVPARAASTARTERTARGVAIAAVVAAEEGARANLELPRLLDAAALGPRDRAFATELAYGTLRMLRACDWLVRQFARGDLEPRVRATACAGAYQLAYMRVPPYAAVAATVAESPARARPVVNAVLRRVADLVAAGPIPWPDLPTRLSYPDWVVGRLREDLGEERALAALQEMNLAPPVSVRADGYTQDLASQAVAAYMAGLLGRARPGTVLDMCAAPGGKATALAPTVPLVVAADIARPRAALVAANARRLGLGNVAAVVADGTASPWAASQFAGVLVDAPCSGLGVLRRRPDARWRVRAGDVERLAGLQRRLLAAAAPLVTPGGLLVYSVCTLTRAETGDIGSWLAASLPAHQGWQPAPRPEGELPWEALGRGALLLPQAAGTDGMYVLALRRGS